MANMSKDRVRFTIPANKMFFSSREFDGYKTLCKQVFGLELPSGATHFNNDVTIICRPSQFARFLIIRNEMGLQNSFKELKPELFTPKPEPTVMVFDVSKNPARHDD